MITGHDIICLSSQDWDDLWTRKQRFMQRLARQGNRVLYVEAQASLASRGLLRADPGRTGRWRVGPRPVEANLHVATLPLVAPGFQMSLAVNKVNNAFLAPILKRWAGRLVFDRPVLWTYNPYSESLLGRLGERLTIYDCVDDFSSTRGLVRRSVVETLEARLIEKARAVVVTHENLYQAKRARARAIHLIPNGVEIEHFQAAARPETPVAPELGALPHPVIGFIGSLQYWIDFDLLRFLAESRPRWSFVLVGPVGRLAPVAKLRDHPNVHLLGRRAYAELPSYLRAFDACLNPYVVDDLARHCSPLKLYEYLASGKPVVSVDMPEARKFARVVGIGRTYAEVLTRLEEAVAGGADDERRAAARLAAVVPHSWDGRFRELEAALEPHLGAPASAGAAP
jgi:glycosyltransferase involved in cell wall biosynthesis